MIPIIITYKKSKMTGPVNQEIKDNDLAMELAKKSRRFYGPIVMFLLVYGIIVWAFGLDPKQFLPPGIICSVLAGYAGSKIR